LLVDKSIYFSHKIVLNPNLRTVMYVQYSKLPPLQTLHNHHILILHMWNEIYCKTSLYCVE